MRSVDRIDPAVGLACAERAPDRFARTLPQWRLGLIFGLDLLTKMSALMMAPIISVVLAVVNRRRGLGPRRRPRLAGVSWVAAVVRRLVLRPQLFANRKDACRRL